MVSTVAKHNPTHAPATSTAVLSQTQTSWPGITVTMTHLLGVALILATFLVTKSHCMPTSNDSSQACTDIVSANAANPSALSRRPAERQRRFLLEPKPLIDTNPSNMLYIGEVNLDGYPLCEKWFADYRDDCQREYENSLNRAILSRKTDHEKTSKQKTPFTFSKDSEWMKEVKCCGMWRARDCLVRTIERGPGQALKERNCPRDLIQRFQQLPTDRKVREDVFDYCSEYSEGSYICRDSSAASIGALRSLPRLLFVISVALLTMRILPRLYLAH